MTNNCSLKKSTYEGRDPLRPSFCLNRTSMLRRWKVGGIEMNGEGMINQVRRKWRKVGSMRASEHRGDWKLELE